MKAEVGDLGDMGENIFAFWCSNAGLIANPSKIDKAGWDFFVDFPFHSGMDVSEIHKSAATCQVQVKSTRGSDKKVRVKLSNLRRMATSQLPSFFVVIEFEKGGEVLGCYVVHVGEVLIRRVIERVHALNAKGEAVDLNKRKMVVSYGQEDKLEVANGQQVKEAFLKHIGNDLEGYVDWKKNFLEGVGFESGYAELSFKIDGKENLKSFVIMSLGIKKKVHVNDFLGFKKRFGILNEKPFVEGEGGIIEIGGMQPRSRGKLVIKEEKFSSGVVFDIDIYISDFYALTPDDLKAFRVSHLFFDAILYPFANKVDFDFSIDNDNKYLINKFCDFLRLIDFISSPEQELYLEVFDESKKLIGFFMSGEADIEDMKKDLEVFEACENLFEYFGIDKEAKVKAGEVINNGQRIKEVNDILTKGGIIRVDFPDGKELLESSLPVAYVFQVAAKVGEYMVGVYAVVVGEVEPLSGAQCRLYSKGLSVEKKLVVRPGQVIRNEDLEEVRKQVIDNYEGDYLVVVGDFE